ncbi:MAG: MlaD family protein [Planctomycetota bacterium]|nr:MlaD family protein [Planctomycetota bacterium]
MNERKMQFRLGVLVVAVVLILAIMVLLLGTPETFKQGFPVRVKFENAGGVEMGTPVRNSGILIGRVSTVDLAENGGAIVTVKMDKGRKLLPNQTFRVAFTSVLGDVQLEVVPVKDAKIAETAIGPDDESVLVGRPAIDPMVEIRSLQSKLSQAIDVISVTGTHLDEFIVKTDRLLDRNESKIDQFFDDLNATVQTVKNTFDNLNDIVGDEKTREDFKKMLDGMPELVESSRTAILQMNETFAAVDENLDNLKGLTEPLGERGPRLVENIDAGLENLKVLSARLTHLAATIDNTEGSLGKLIHDDTLYQNLSQASKNIREISVKLKPIVNDARIISDRMARHPGSILRDAMRPGPGTKGLPGELTLPQQHVPMQRNTPVFQLQEPSRIFGPKSTSNAPCIGGRETSRRNY